MLALYIAAPLIVQYLVFVRRIPLFEALPPFLLLFIVLLTLGSRFSWRETLTRLFPLRILAQIVATFMVAGGALTLFALATNPQDVLRWARASPETYFRIIMLYALVSVTTQELVYRVHFFQRYAPLFGDRQLLAVVVNAAAFALSHIFFPNPLTVYISFAGGLLFAYRYLQTRSFWAVFLEHLLYGSLVFALGMGRYFYTGVSNF